MYVVAINFALELHFPKFCCVVRNILNKLCIKMWCYPCVNSAASCLLGLHHAWFQPLPLFTVKQHSNSQHGQFSACIQIIHYSSVAYWAHSYVPSRWRYELCLLTRGTRCLFRGLWSWLAYLDLHWWKIVVEKWQIFIHSLLLPPLSLSLTLS